MAKRASASSSSDATTAGSLSAHAPAASGATASRRSPKASQRSSSGAGVVASSSARRRSVVAAARARGASRPAVSSTEDRADDIVDRSLTLDVVAERVADGDRAGPSRRDAEADQLPRVDEEAGAHAFTTAARRQLPHLFAERSEAQRLPGVHAALVRDDPRFEVAGRVAEVDRHEALSGRVLQILQHALVARIEREDEQEVVVRLEDLARLVDRQDAAVIRQGMDQHDGVLPRLHDLVEVADGA